MKYKTIRYGFAAAVLLAMGCSSSRQHNFSEKNRLPIDRKVDSVLKLMTLEEKVGQMNQYNGFWDVTGPVPKDGQAAKKYENLKKGLVGSMLNVRGVKDVRALQKIAVEETRLGIPLIFGFDVVHGYKTISPIPLAEAASWDLEAMKKSAEIAAAESAVAGLNWTFAPMVDISRDARWGRVMEGAGEDPYLGSQIAIARVKGFQGDKFNEFRLAACTKHFAGYGFAESGRDYNTVDISDNTLHNIILPPFKATVDAGVLTFMNSFNELEGIPATGNSYLQRELLKKDWKFDGFVVSDWGSLGEMIPHGYAKDLKDAAMKAANAGSDMDMESYGYVSHLADLVKEGKVSEDKIDDAVRRILKVKFELGLFDNPYKYCDENREKEYTGKKEFHEGVLDMAKKSIVLLKNENSLLPLKKQGQKIAVIGALANDKTSPLGSWRIGADDNTAVSFLEGMANYKGNQITYEKGADVALGEPRFMLETKINTTDKSGFEKAIAAAKQADVVIMVLGEHGLQSGEGRSRSDITLPGVQQELLEAVYKVNPNIVLVLQNGRPLAIPWAAKNIPAIVEAWHLGTQSGHAIAQVLYGDYNPSGKLPMTFPRNVGQLPIYYNYKNTGRPSTDNPESVFWSHYTDIENTPLYPFGYGLSYSKFEYSNLKLDTKTLHKNGKIKVSVDVKNNSTVDGKEVVQLYIRDLIASATRPVRELKGFELTEIKAGQTKTVTFTINEKTIEFYSARKIWEAEPGDFQLFVGGSSMATLQADFNYSN
ncbi:MAG: beta-glucosidase BglX [Flavobacteriaceae bacterium]|jgi:beta-glucosidase|uniref:beta-glucosidase BglX n=1 Tax=Flavobacterium sp. Leaf359 TaxID=1736351 RepID=UPI0006F58A4C|nr:beta-glucosidase BglX [Flavobacterium sp. Leaf359]KQS53301.1 beta-glucosidase [Flavobacterium sp. Leaf359]PZO29993.1 MAG: beta-glucosidase BglX [Flavobacteriaceae bacterium]